MTGVENEHRTLVELGARWARREGFSVIEMELTTAGSRERPDVIAFRSSTSLVIEAKCSRSDFLADRNKPERNVGGLGVYRFYLCPAGMLTAAEVPQKWGLLWVEGRKVRAIKRPTGNCWPGYDLSCPVTDWTQFMHEPDLAAEWAVMYSIARRRSLSRSDERYEQQLRKERCRADRLARQNDALRADNDKLRMQEYLREQGVSTLMTRTPPEQVLKTIPRKVQRKDAAKPVETLPAPHNAGSRTTG